MSVSCVAGAAWVPWITEVKRLRRAWFAGVLAAGGFVISAPAAGLPLEPCRLPGIAHDARCGRLARPLDPSRPDGPHIDIHVAVLPALARSKRPDPVFFFAGGPGQGAIDLAGHVSRLLARFGSRRDIVLIDQRGTGRSTPLACDGGGLPDGFADLDAQVARLLECRDALAQRPPLQGASDLRHFTTTIAADDADAVRQALGVAQLNLVGVSYGTRVALEVLRRHPQTVRRVVLDGVAPPDMALPRSFSTDAQAALDDLLRWCALDEVCRQRHPQLAAQWRAVLGRLPVQVVRPHPVSGADGAVTLTRAAVLGMVRMALYAPLLSSALPWAIDEAAQGRWLPLVGLGTALSEGARTPLLAVGMHFAVICAEDYPRLSASPDPAGADFGDSLGALYRRVCAAWPRGDVPPGFERVPPSPVPVLLLSGGLDPVTPPRHGGRVRTALGAQARHVVVPNAGHGVMALACVRELVFSFVDAAAGAPAPHADAACAPSVPRPPAWRPPAGGGGGP
jgi:pimeloyl-ACP methyl ester carboxylesterase